MKRKIQDTELATLSCIVFTYEMSDQEYMVTMLGVLEELDIWNIIVESKWPSAINFGSQN